MIIEHLVRSFHGASPLWTAPKSPLAALRKKTGYTFSNCKKALDMHQNDLTKAENWLREQAQSLGWSKATKLEGRSTTQGLVGVLVKNNTAAMVEVNCETDFVARNENFRNMIDNVAHACVNSVSGDEFQKVYLDSNQLKSLKSSDGKSLSDHLALLIGSVGENATLKRALIYSVPKDIQLATYAHPSGETANDTHLGKFAGIVALKRTTGDADIEDLGKKVCQHVVGMDPKKVGTKDDAPAESQDDEICLIHQEYLLDDTLLVGELLNDGGVEVVDFKRFGCGEDTDGGGQSLESVETCQ